MNIPMGMRGTIDIKKLETSQDKEIMYMLNADQITISNIPEISAIYFALLQSGYDYYAMERSRKHISYIQGYISADNSTPFFAKVKQNTCEVYPYWPRAAILETTSFYLSPDRSHIRDYDALRNQIMNATNIADRERDQKLWNWITGFPTALSEVLACDAFKNYFEWEQKWLATQNTKHEAALRVIENCLDMCVTKYGSPVQNIRIVINPIKCVYSADFHMVGNSFIFCSGMFRTESVIHEFLHHVVHPAVIDIADIVATAKRIYPGIDESYYLSGDNAGRLNAFEEYAVRVLTADVMNNKFPDDLISYLKDLVLSQ